MTRWILLVCLMLVGLTAEAKQPNVILILTDDQGYGDVGAHGNPKIKTPNLDKLWAQSVRLTDYHVDPTCSPTRSALMSGRYSTRTGVWHTIMGRSMMSPDEVTLAEMFTNAGYRCGMFGKWHLGDNYPLRAQDQGFHTAVYHGGGGVGQGPDYWGNDYFDDTYWRNGKTEKFKGYCTDIWFAEATKFIEKNRDQPFFCYIATNAPHGPYNVAKEYSQPYAEAGVPSPMDNFYGMITNIDENVGKLREKLEELGLSENTIFIFTTDNGTAAGVASGRTKGKWTGFNDGMRGRKGSEYDGGHRVPFFIHWPAGNLTKGRDVSQLCAHVDVLPTLAELTGVKLPTANPLDGTSLKPLLYGEKIAWPERTLFAHSQRIQYPEKWRKCAVMTERWRLVNGNQLFDIQADPGQETNLAEKHPEVVAELRKAYEGWWQSLKPVFDDYVRIRFGGQRQHPNRLMSHDWHCENQRESAWSQGAVKRGLIGNGPWSVYVETPGKYEITLFRWPDHLDQAMGCTKASFQLGEAEQRMDLKPSDTEAKFTATLAKGPAMFWTYLTRENGKTHGAYYAKVRLVE